MVTVGSKTPVSILQEYGVQVGLYPTYELIRDTTNSTGSHNPTFTYRVHVGDLFADGSGSSKQRAKHDAAELMLDIIKNRPEVKEQGPVADLLSLPQDVSIAFNAIGSLKEYCEVKNHPEPEFILIQDEGPAHAKIFTMKCTISQLDEIGTARTKKQAKHISAHNMLIRLQKLSGEECNAVMRVADQSADTASNKSWQTKLEEEIDEAYFALSKVKRKPIQSPMIADRHKSIINLVNKSPTLAKLLAAEVKFQDIDNKVATLETIANELNCKLITSNIDSPVVFVKLQLIFDICCFGLAYEEAAVKVLKMFLDYFE